MNAVDCEKKAKEEAKFIVKGVKDSLIVLLAAAACLASLYTFVYF